MSSMTFRGRYPWNDANRFQLVEVVKVVKGEAKNHSLKWREVARRLHNDSDMEESMFARLCAKQFDNLYRAYVKFKQDGDQPPRLTTAVIEEFDEIFAGAALDGDGIGGSMDTKSSSPDPATQRDGGKDIHAKLSWTTSLRLRLLRAVRAAATAQGKIHWAEVVASLPNRSGISEDRLCMLCMKQFTDLSFTYKEFKVVGSRPRRLTTQIIQTLEELYEIIPNLNPLPVGEQEEQEVFENDRENVSRDRMVSSPTASKDAPEHMSSVRDDVPDSSIPPDEPSSASQEAPSPHSEREEDETIPRPPITPVNEMARLGKRKERAEISSNPPHDEQEAGFDRLDRELLQLQSWLKKEVLPVGRAVLAKVKEYGKRHHIDKRSKNEPHDDFDKLIDEASQKSTVLAIRAQFQQARAKILKEVKETIERVGMDLLGKSTRPLENGKQGLTDPSQAGPSRSG